MNWKDEKYVGWTAQVIICELKDDNIGPDNVKIARAIQRLAFLKDTLKDNKYKESKTYLDWKKFVNLRKQGKQ
jgi:hypothetical protein